MVTYPELLTPDEAVEGAQYLRFLTRSTNRVNTGIGAARQDVNVSITGGTRVEIKGVAHIKLIPELTHNEAFRQKSLLEIKKILLKRFPDPAGWSMKSAELIAEHLPRKAQKLVNKGNRIFVVNLPGFSGILSFFTQPGRKFADEIADRLKVIACLEKPNMTDLETPDPIFTQKEWSSFKNLVEHEKDDTLIIFWTSEQDMKTALDTIEERCRLAFIGVPNETRKSLPDGTTVFERVLPGPNRMYPDTDSAPIPIEDTMIEGLRQKLPMEITDQMRQLEKWCIPRDTHTYIMRRNLFSVIENIISLTDFRPGLVGTLFGHTLKNAEGRRGDKQVLPGKKLQDLFIFLHKRNIKIGLLKSMIPILTGDPDMDFEDILTRTGYQRLDKEEILARISKLKLQFSNIRTSQSEYAGSRWMMGQLKTAALGNIDMKIIREAVDGGHA